MWKLARDSEINLQIIKENGGFTKIVNKMIVLAQKDIIEDGYTEEYINAVRGYGNPKKTLVALREENQQTK